MPQRTRQTCQAEDCTRYVHGHGLCLMHYKRRRTALRNPKKTPAEKFWAHVPTGVTPGDCWEWQGSRDACGYGCLWVLIDGRRLQRAHRAAWALYRGPIPDGMLIRHRCDNPPCCNPDHLELGTYAQNSDDKVARRRQAAGPRLPQTRVTDEQLRDLRAAYRVVNGKSNATELAQRYGVSRGHLMHLVSARGQERIK